MTPGSNHFKMKFSQMIIFLCFVLISATNHVLSAENPCGDWEPYKEDKCLKIFAEPGLADYQDAENYCQVEQEAHLISIGLVENQNFIENFLKTNQIADNVWIGLKYTNGTYQWSDGTEAHYSNWDVGSPKNLSDHCVQIGTDETEFGKWSDVLCTKKNLVVCEKLQLWSQNFLQTTVMDLLYNLNVSQLEIAELQSEVKTLKSEVSTLTSTVTTLTENPVPIGFIYVQLPGEKEPDDIWSGATWTDISSTYAGLFFRVYGNGSESFGTEQSDDSPRLTAMRANWDYKSQNQPRGDSINVVANGQWSDYLTMWGDDFGFDFQVIVSKTETRPRNKAVKIWKRTG